MQYAVKRFSTDALPENDRLPAWREEFGRNMLHVDLEPLGGAPLHAEATLGAILELRWMKFRGTAMRFQRTRPLAAMSNGHIGFVINGDDGSPLSQGNREVSLKCGDGCLIFTDKPGMIAGPAHAGLLLPRDALTSRVRNVESLSAHRIAAGTDALRLLTGYLGALPPKLAAASTDLQRVLVDHIYDLASLAINPDRPADEYSLSATASARLAIALTYLETHFAFPGLTITTVAADQGISPRYLQRLIESTGATFSERLTELRLQHARSLLSDARRGQRRIADVALRCGFSDPSYFNRIFRRRFGETPRDMRSRAGTTPRQ